MKEKFLTNCYNRGEITPFAGYCGHCDQKLSIDILLSFKHGTTLFFYVGQCPSCGGPIIIDNINDKTFPPSREFINVESLPENISTLYDEIRDAFSVEAYTCAVIAARTLLNHIAVEKGADKNRNFTYYVEYIVDEYFGKRDAKIWLDKIRSYANDSVHHLEIATKENTKSIIKFIETILKIIYEYPAEVKENTKKEERQND